MATNFNATTAFPNLSGRMVGTGTTGGFNPNPAPQGGAGAYGAVPGPVGLPPSTYSQLNTNVPQFPNLTAATSDVIGSELAGGVSPNTVKFLQDRAAAMGVTMGMPGMNPGTFNTSNLMRLLGTTAEDQAHRGVADFNSFTSTLAPTQLSPSLQADIAFRNSENAARPNPEQERAQQIQEQKDLYLWKQAHSGSSGGMTDYYNPWRKPQDGTRITPYGGPNALFGPGMSV